MSANSLSIAGLQLELRACTVPQRAVAIEHRLLELVQRLLPRMLSAPPGDAGVRVFIDRLCIDSAINAAWDDDRIAATLSKALAAGIGQALGRRDGRTFADRAEWLAAFFVALGDGHAWQRWWFAEMEGLRMLPASAALRTAIVDEGTTALQALARLERASLQRVLSVLADADVARVLAAWAAQPVVGAALPPMASLWSCAAAIGTGSRALLSAVVELARHHAADAAMGSVVLLAALADLSAARARPAVVAVSGDPHEALRARCRAANVDAGWLQAIDAAQTAALCEALGEGEPTAGPRTDDAGGELSRSEHGGAFALCVVAGWMGLPVRWHRALADDASCASSAAPLARALVLAVVAMALHPDPPQRVFGDPALQRAFGLDDAAALLRRHAAASARVLRGSAPRGAAGGDAPPLIGRHSDRRLAAHAAALLARLGERVPGCEAAGQGWLRGNLLCGRATIEVDAAASCAVATCSRPPLHVLLLLAGLARAGVALPGWRVELRSEAGP